MDKKDRSGDPTDLVKISPILALSLPDTRERLAASHILIQDVLRAQKSEITLGHTDLVLLAEVFNNITHGINYLDYLDNLVTALSSKEPFDITNSKAGNLEDGAIE